ncbi:MAG: A/G-specific adenine glycosylase [Anaerolineae bacterium]|nr:A/G-specific adenine glycosylase [Anaerolineae bacterium]
MTQFPDFKPYLIEHRGAAQRALLDWFATHARDLPWRRERTPYRVWIAEVMLQQTQVETACAYYERFVERFPALADLAAAPLEAVLKLWEGLGYYSRARALHRAAQQVLTEFGGELPADVAALRRLPGIGAYTAGAIASIAFGLPTPAVDGNVRRVMARLLALPAPTAAELEKAVRILLTEDAPGAFTEALMELGALVCRPAIPHCEECPWQTLCQAKRQDRQTDYPAPLPRKQIPHYDVAAAVIVREDGHLLVAQRRLQDMLGGLWEFPGGKREDGETLPEALQRELKEEMDIEISVGAELIVVRHAYTHFRITLHAFLCQLAEGTPRCIECEDYRWATPEEIQALPMAVTDRRIAQALAD